MFLTNVLLLFFCNATTKMLMINMAFLTIGPPVIVLRLFSALCTVDFLPCVKKVCN